ncbi:MAG: LOW QUALITY PROTEIN: hypothetical protein KVP17_000680 [Porospora cf. gigantea B]|uniref:uncharacterized protein n=1 Tax=Porospora cf. gigantea B TaxID=2853592 RepID=UPI0035717C55|nr:MAG: LOW QUALITY PROTEIN: hypothetical protein KVP17_000680 [Porospora cf. gigantea B]
MWECLLSEESKLPKATTTFDALVTKYKNAESSRPVLERRYSDGSKLQQRYIWEVNGKVPFVLSVFEVHYDLLLDHFFEDKVQAANRKAKTSRVAMEQDSSPQGVLDPGRLQTAMISFKALGLLKDSELLLEVVRDLNLEKLEGLKEGTLGAVIPLMLTTDEVEALSSAKPEQLLPIEKLLLQLAASPRFKERATVINLGWNIPGHSESRLRFYLSDLNQKIDLVEGVIRDALNSVEVRPADHCTQLGFFRSLFGLFLRAGNYINHGTNKGEAFGIQISSFDTLRRYVGYDGLTSFYRYVAIEIDQQYPSSWDVLTWTQNIPKLRNYSQEDIQKSISDLIVELQGVTEEVVVNSKLHEDKFLALFGPLVEEASAVLTAAKERAANIGAKLWDLARLFDKTASGPAEGLDILMRLHGLAKDLLMARDLYRSHVMTEMKIKQLDARKKEKQRRELEDCERTDSTSDALSARAVSVSVPDSIRAQGTPRLVT